MKETIYSCIFLVLFCFGSYGQEHVKSDDEISSPHISLTYDDFNNTPTFHFLFHFFEYNLTSLFSDTQLLMVEGFYVSNPSFGDPQFTVTVLGANIEGLNFKLIITLLGDCKFVEDGRYFRARLLAEGELNVDEKIAGLVVVEDENPIEDFCDKLCLNTVCEGIIPYMTISDVTGDYWFEVNELGNVDCATTYYIDEVLFEDPDCPEIILPEHGEEDEKDIGKINFYPNPVIDFVQYKTFDLDSSEDISVNIFDVEGNLVFQSPINFCEKMQRLNIKNLETGQYFAIVFSKIKILNVTKFLKL